MDAESARVIGAGLAAVGAGLAAIGVGSVFGQYLNGAVRNPEADAKMGMISYSSPLGRALIGRQVGEEVEVTVPAGDKFYLIQKIEFI